MNSTSTMKLSHKRPPRATPESSQPDLPWPIPSEGFRVEVCRWFHEGTETRNGWHWVYTVTASCSKEWDGQVQVYFRASRAREDYFTKRLSFPEIVSGWRDVEVSERALRSKSAPAKIVRAFEEIVSQVRRKAAQHEAAYERATDTVGDW